MTAIVGTVALLLVVLYLKSTSFGRGAISSMGGFRVTAAGVCDGTSTTKDIKLYWGGILIATLNVQTGDSKEWSMFAEFWNISSTENQRWLVRAWDGTTLELMDLGADDVDTL